MASIVFLFVLLFSTLSSPTATSTPSTSRPHGLILPVKKDQTTKQYVTQISQRTPLVPVKLTLDLGGESLWTDCVKTSIVSSTYKPVHCGSPLCSLLDTALSCPRICDGAPKPGCHNNSCLIFPENTVFTMSTTGELAKDVAVVQAYDASNPGPLVSLPRLYSACATTYILYGLAGGVKGMAGLGRSPFSLPSQFSHAFRLPRKFAICLGSSTGVVFFGDGPYTMLPGIDISKQLTYTPLLTPDSVNISQYYIGVQGIKINGKLLPINASMLSFDDNGFGGAKISTVDRYTILDKSIYDIVSDAFVNSMTKVPRAEPVEPFKVCYKSSSISSTRLGTGVPPIELVLQNGKSSWTFFGANSMVSVNKDVLCLGFVDGGSDVRNPIVIGGYQLENAVLQFDLARSRLGFASTILGLGTTCSNFNFSSKS